jgi:hypothetical protein
MALFGRYYSQRDINLVNQINAELMRDIIETLVVLFKIAPNETNTNIYGEAVAAEGKSFYSGVELSSIIDRGDISTDDEGFGPDRDQTVVFKFRELSLKDASFYPEVGDIIFWDNEYYEIDNTDANQYFAGKNPDFPYSENPLNPGLENFGYNVSVICTAHYTPADKFNIIKQRL